MHSGIELSIAGIVNVITDVSEVWICRRRLDDRVLEEECQRLEKEYKDWPSRHENGDNGNEQTSEHCVKHLVTTTEQIRMGSPREQKQLSSLRRDLNDKIIVVAKSIKGQ